MRPVSPTTFCRFSSSSLSAPFFLRISHFSTSSSAQNFHTHPSFRRHHDEEVRNVRVSVWWDFENCNLPAGINVFRVAHAITAAIRANGIKGPIQITAFGDMLQLSRANQEALSSTGVNLTHVPHGGKNSADRSLLVDLMYWVSQNPPPAHLFLISGDRDFASILHRLRMNNYNILLASPENAPGVLCSAASIMWPWQALLTGEKLTGKYFNQPPDGPYGSWYGHYKVPLEDPYPVMEQPALSQTEKLSEPGADCKLCMIPASSEGKPRPIPRAVLKQIHKILKSHPKGISISDLRLELRKCNLNIDRDFYGYKKFTHFLLSLPHILKLQSLGEGNFLVHGSPKSSEQSGYNLGLSTEPVSDNGGEDLNLAWQLDSEDRSMNVSENRNTPLPTSDEPNVEEPYRELQQPLSPDSSDTRALDGNSLLPSSAENVKSSTKPQQLLPPDEKPLSSTPENGKTSLPIDQKVVKVSKDQPELLFPPAAMHDSASEVGYFKRIWRKWFGSRDNVTGTSSHNGHEELCTSGDGAEKEGHDTPLKQCTSVENSGMGKVKKCRSSTSQIVDQAPAASSDNESATDNKTVTSYEVHSNKSETSPGIFYQIVNWCKFRRSSQCSVKLSDESCDGVNLMDPHSQENKLFSTDSFWSDMECFMDTPKGLVIVSESRTREQMALNLQKEGPLCLRFLCKGDLLYLVDLLISEKKWVEECPSQKSPFKLTQRDGKRSLDHSNGSNRLRSIFVDNLSKQDRQRFTEHDGEEKCQKSPLSEISLPAIENKPSDRCRSEIIANCQKLVKEIVKEYPEGYNMGLFRKLFLDRYGYHLDLRMLGYQKLASLLQTMPGVQVESSYIIPPSKAPKIFDKETSVPSIQKHNSESSDASSKDDGGDSPWEELGPVANTCNKNEVEVASRRKAVGSTGFDYEPSLSDDTSDSEGETSRSESEGIGRARADKVDSSLLQILDSWYSSKNGGSSKAKSENVDDGMVDSTKLSGTSTGTYGTGAMNGTLGNNGRKQRPQKSFTFVADSVGDKDKLIDGILGSLKKSSDTRMET